MKYNGIRGGIVNLRIVLGSVEQCKGCGRRFITASR
jgi:hypothetical protein